MTGIKLYYQERIPPVCGLFFCNQPIASKLEECSIVGIWNNLFYNEILGRFAVFHDVNIYYPIRSNLNELPNSHHSQSSQTSSSTKTWGRATQMDASISLPPSPFFISTLNQQSQKKKAIMSAKCQWRFPSE